MSALNRVFIARNGLVKAVTFSKYTAFLAVFFCKNLRLDSFIQNLLSLFAVTVFFIRKFFRFGQTNYYNSVVQIGN